MKNTLNHNRNYNLKQARNVKYFAKQVLLTFFLFFKIYF